MTENDVSAIVLDAAIEVHRLLGGPGLLEKVYEEALVHELTAHGLRVERQVPVPIHYKGIALSTPLRIDLLVNRLVIIECKAASVHHDLFEAQALTYLRLTGKKLALVINFGMRRVVDGFHRVVNGL